MQWFIVKGMNIREGAGRVLVLGMFAMTLLFYEIFKPVNRSLPLLAAFFSLVGLAFEVLRWQPGKIRLSLASTWKSDREDRFMIIGSRFRDPSMTLGDLADYIQAKTQTRMTRIDRGPL